ncbi:hypothetical protein EV715DRAFT_289785 [Schizophyllum commune]
MVVGHKASKKIVLLHSTARFILRYISSKFVLIASSWKVDFNSLNNSHPFPVPSKTVAIPAMVASLDDSLIPNVSASSILFKQHISVVSVVGPSISLIGGFPFSCIIGQRRRSFGVRIGRRPRAWVWTAVGSGSFVGAFQARLRLLRDLQVVRVVLLLGGLHEHDVRLRVADSG